MKPIFTVVLFAASLAATAVRSDGVSCGPMIFDTDDCLVGSWVGTNTIAERVREMFGSMAPAGVSRQVFPDDYARVIGMVVYPDGFYATIPFQNAVTMHDIEDGEVTVTDMNLVVSSNFGWIWTADSSLRFCALEGSTAMLHMDVSGPGGNASAAIDPNSTPNTFMPKIAYSCAGGTLSMTVALPEPIGPVDHYFTRIPTDRFDDEMRDLLDSRFAPAGGGGE